VDFLPELEWWTCVGRLDIVLVSVTGLVAWEARLAFGSLHRYVRRRLGTACLLD
jgi:hypothetical protein